MTSDRVVTEDALAPLPEAAEGARTFDPVFFNYSRDELRTLLAERFAMPAYRADQLFDWVYKREITDIDAMSNLARRDRELLKSVFEFPEARLVSRQISVDGTRKYLVGVSGGGTVEAVMIKQPSRMTLCISSQVGCGMGCTFCRTATMGFQRNLSTSEILQQVRLVIADAKNFGDRFSNIVFMGMGEPLHNVHNVVRAIRILSDDRGFEIAPRRITVSTSGLLPGLEKFAAADTNVNLAVSLNATNDQVRSEIMPVNRRYPLSELIGALKNFPLGARKKITLEYVLLRGVNDTQADLDRLPKLINGVRAKLNLIPYNENAGLGFSAPTMETIQRWQRTLLGKGIEATVRWSKGQDISAACGQLATDKVRQRKGTELRGEGAKPEGLRVIDSGIAPPLDSSPALVS